jgi:hypothetical protein
MLIDIYVLTPEKVLDLKKNIAWIKGTIITEISNLDVIRVLEIIESELSKDCRHKRIDPENFV